MRNPLTAASIFAAKVRREWELALLLRSDLPGFDAAFYRHRYDDVRDSGVDPLDHFLLFGWKEGRDPSAGFSTEGYLRSNPDVRAAGINPLLHYLDYGLSEGRQGHQRDTSSAAASSQLPI